MTEEKALHDKIDKLIVLASTQSVILTELVTVVARIQNKISRLDSPFSSIYSFSNLKDEIKIMSEQLDALVGPVSDED